MQNDPGFIQEIGKKEGFDITYHEPMAGGSINQVSLLQTSIGKKVLKLNDSRQFPNMFQAEEEGLKALDGSNSFAVPEVHSTGEVRGTAYILLEYVSRAPESKEFWPRFGQCLAVLHRTTAPQFGFPSSNYIGSLPQSNNPCDSAADFYVTQRLEPQFRLAADKGFSFPHLDRFFSVVSTIVPVETPALIHGDLWRGNFLINEKSAPCLIDPAVSFAPREMDLAMMKLFGGFPETVFVEYNKNFPLLPGIEERLPLWQLYYLLVHLNIFGRSYLPQVIDALDHYR